MFTNFINWIKRLFGYKAETVKVEVVEEVKHMDMAGPRDKTKKVKNGPSTKHGGHGSTKNDKVR